MGAFWWLAIVPATAAWWQGLFCRMGCIAIIVLLMMDLRHQLSEHGAIWHRLRLRRPISTRRAVSVGVALCAAIALIVLIAVAEGGIGMTIYARELGTGAWSRHRITEHGHRGTMGAIEDRVCRFLGIPRKPYAITRKTGENRPVSPSDVPYLSIPQVARFLPPSLGWSIQIRVYDVPRRLAKSSAGRVDPARAPGRFEMATVVCVRAGNHDEFEGATQVHFMGGDDEPMVISISRPVYDFPEYWISIDDNDQVVSVHKEEGGYARSQDIDPGTMGDP
jgi:hypothetical protein